MRSLDHWAEDERTAALYQVIGSLAAAAGVSEDPAVVRALDLASQGTTKDGQAVLPFSPHYPRPSQIHALGVDEIVQILKRSIKVDASGLAPAVVTHFIDGYEDAARAILAALRPVTAPAAPAEDK